MSGAVDVCPTCGSADRGLGHCEPEMPGNGDGWEYDEFNEVWVCLHPFHDPVDDKSTLSDRAQSDPRPGWGDPIADLVLCDVRRRKVQGVDKYGRALQAGNGRDALIDLYEELLDAVHYVRQRIEETSWRRSEDGLPPAGQPVLVSDSRRVRIAAINHGSPNYWREQWGGLTHVRGSLWCCLPEPR